MQPYFKHLTNLPVLPDKYILEGLYSKFELIKRPNLLRGVSSFEETSFFKLLKDRYEICYVSYCQSPANSCYNWHIDLNRNVGINWVIKTNTKAGTYYKEPIEEFNPGEGVNPLFHKLIEVDYKLYNPMLLNTGLEHCVINNYSETRIIMTLSILNNAKFAEVSDFLSKLNIESY